jgi:hypothetical protein
MHLMLHARWQGDYQEEAWKEVQQIKNAQTHATQTQHVTHLMLHARWRGGYEEEARRKEVQHTKKACTGTTQTQHVTHLMLHARWQGGYEEEVRRKEVQRSGTGRKVGEAALVGEQREERG